MSLSFDVANSPILRKFMDKYPEISFEVENKFKRLITEKLTPWVFFNTGSMVPVEDFHGRSIQYRGLAFEGSPREVFWGNFIVPFLEAICAWAFDFAADRAAKRKADYFDIMMHTHQSLTNGLYKVYNEMQEIDRRLRGKGFPQQVLPRDVSFEINKMQTRFDEYRDSALSSFKTNPKGGYPASGKERKRKSVPSKLRALLQKENESKCPFCSNEDVDHFEVHHIDEDPNNNDIQNLLLVCPLCHSKITKGDIEQNVIILTKNKMKDKSNGEAGMSAKIINFRNKVETAVIGDHATVNITTRKTVKSKYPEGCVGFSTIKANYIGYLIDRYHQYKEFQEGKSGMNYAIFPSQIKAKFKVGRTRTIYNIPLTRFDELASYIQARIDGTLLAKSNKAKGQNKNYQYFDEYVKQNS